MRTLAVLLTLWLAACGVFAPPTGVPLAFDQTSYSSRSESLARFEKTHRIEVVEDSALAPGDSRPPFSIYVVRVQGVSDKGLPGQLRLKFFNDRLTGVWFYPDDAAAYRSAMQAEASVARVDGHVKTWTAEDYRGKWYVAWEDERLWDEEWEWIETYS